MLNETKLSKILKELRSLPSETEWFEFKEAKNSYDFDDIGKYFSALSNEANLKNKDYSWLVSQDEHGYYYLNFSYLLKRDESAKMLAALFDDKLGD